MERKQRILIIRLSALGDVAMTIPAIHAFAAAHKEMQVTVLTRPFFRRLFVGSLENVDFVLFEDQHRSLLGLCRLIRKLHKMHFDCVCDLHNVLRSWVIDSSFRLTGTKVLMVSKRRAERKRLLAGSPEQRRTPSMPFTRRYVELLNKVAPFAANPSLSKASPSSSIRKIGIAPAARYPNKTYPMEHMREVVRLLAEKPETTVYLFGGKAEIPLFELWKTLSDRVVCVAGTMQIEDELKLMGELDVMVSMDSANMHLASLMGTRVVSLWGSTTPHCGFLGWGQREEDCLWADLPCQPCTIAGSKECKLGEMKCWHAIKPIDVVNRIYNVES
ncbi:MAG: glycosyltransferase family 9 protein [Bacteroidales bacterium]|nr:glycosyltransferase family 9 protein [Candidatus Physcousia equi]